MGTGVGGGIVVNGKLLTGRQGIGGEWGHTFLDDSGGPCYCGNTGCVEKIISGTALEKYYNERAPVKRRLREIVQRHKDGIDPIASETMERLIYFFGKGLANVINIIDPTVIVLGGGVGNIDLLYTEGVESVKNFVFNNRLDTVFLHPKLGDSAGVFGAALL
jgi:predicted NBD/HSP70 family sugar kinase